VKDNQGNVLKDGNGNVVFGTGVLDQLKIYVPGEQRLTITFYNMLAPGKKPDWPILTRAQCEAIVKGVNDIFRPQVNVTLSKMMEEQKEASQMWLGAGLGTRAGEPSAEQKRSCERSSPKGFRPAPDCSESLQVYKLPACFRKKAANAIFPFFGLCSSDSQRQRVCRFTPILRATARSVSPVFLRYRLNALSTSSGLTAVSFM